MIETIKNFVLVNPSGKNQNIADAITNMSFNHTLDGGMQLTVEVADYDRHYLLDNYFQLNQEFTYGGRKYLLASVQISQGEGYYATARLEFRDKIFQQLKNDFKPEVYRSANGFEFAQKIAKKYKLVFVGQNVKGKQSTIKVKSKNNTESVWNVLQRSANDNQYLCFIADDRLFFGSPKFLLGRWGLDSVTYTDPATNTTKTIEYIPLVWPPQEDTQKQYGIFFPLGSISPAPIGSAHAFPLMQMPDVRHSADSKKQAEGSAVIWGDNARQMKAGMTVMVYGMGEAFDLAYLVTSVDYIEAEPEPVKINFATVSKLAPEDKAKVDEKVAETVVISGSGSSDSTSE